MISSRPFILTGILLASYIFQLCLLILVAVTIVEPDWIDRVVERLSQLQPGLPVDAYHVTGRISRIAARIAQREDEVFGRYGLNRGDVGVLSALHTSLPSHTLSPTQLFRGLMLSSAGMTKRLDRLEQRGLVKRKPAVFADSGSWCPRQPARAYFSRTTGWAFAAESLCP